MRDDLWGFIGVQRKVVTDADKKVNQLIQKIFQSMEIILDIDLKHYDNIRQLIKEKRNANDDQSYFWDWLDENGLFYLEIVLENNSLPYEGGMHELLDYHEMILDLDIENQISDSYFMSIADTLTSIGDYVQTISEQAATVEQYCSKGLRDTEYHVSDVERDSKQKWIVRNNKSCFPTAGFLFLYI